VDDARGDPERNEFGSRSRPETNAAAADGEPRSLMITLAVEVPWLGFMPRSGSAGSRSSSSKS